MTLLAARILDNKMDIIYPYSSCIILAPFKISVNVCCPGSFCDLWQTNSCSTLKMLLNVMVETKIFSISSIVTNVYCVVGYVFRNKSYDSELCL